MSADVFFTIFFSKYTSVTSKNRMVKRYKKHNDYLPKQLSHHVSVVSPRSKLHETSLLVEREVLDINFTGRLVNSRRLPLHYAVGMQYCLRHYRHLVVTIGTAGSERYKINSNLMLTLSFRLRGPSEDDCIWMT